MNSLTWPQVPWLARIIAWRQPRTQKKAIVEAAEALLVELIGGRLNETSKVATA